MTFFDAWAEPEPAEQPRYVQPSWRRVPREVVPVALPLAQLVYRSSEYAIVMTGVEVYSTGLLIALSVLRHPEAPPSELSMPEVMHGHRPYGRGEQLRIGVLHASGARANYPEVPGGVAPRADPPSAFISSEGGGGSADVSTGEFFIWPIPETGDVTVFFRWTAGGLEETSIVIDGDQLRTAARSTAEIWPGASAGPDEGSETNSFY